MKNQPISEKVSTSNWRDNFALITKIFIEDLNLKAMQKLWGKKISDLAFYRFVQILKYQATKFNVEVVAVDRLQFRKWFCPKCGAKHDRNVNATKNVLKFGLEHRLIIAESLAFMRGEYVKG